MKNGDLEFKDWPMFDRVMEENHDICRRVLEAVIGQDVDRVDNVIAERAIKPRLGSRGVRFDALVHAGGKVYDVEMQTSPRGDLGKRMRYYQSSIDTTNLREGRDYDKLPPVFVIFICAYDEFKVGLPVYAFDMRCDDAPSVRLGHGCKWIVLNARAWAALPEGRLRSLLEYIATSNMVEDDLVADIAHAVERANGDAIWKEDRIEMLTFEEDLRIQQRIWLRKATEEGLEKGEDRMGALMARLLGEGRNGDALRAATDAEYRAGLFEEYGL